MKRRERRNGGRLLGLTLSDAGVQSLIAAGAEANRGILEDPESLRSGAAPSDGVIHCAFDHSAFGNDFSKFLAVCEKDRCAIEALGDALNGLLLDLPRPPTCVWSSLKPWWMKRLKTSEWGPVRAYVEKPGVRAS